MELFSELEWSTSNYDAQTDAVIETKIRLIGRLFRFISHLNEFEIERENEKKKYQRLQHFVGCCSKNGTLNETM